MAGFNATSTDVITEVDTALIGNLEVTYWSDDFTTIQRTDENGNLLPLNMSPEEATEVAAFISFYND